MSALCTDRDIEALIQRTLAVCRRRFAVAGRFSLGINLLMLMVPLYMLQLFYRVLLSHSMETLLLLSLLAGVALLTPALLEAAPMARPAMSLPVPRGALTVEAVHYAQPGQTRPVLTAVSAAYCRCY